MLESLDITVEEVRAQVARIVGQGDEVTTGQIPFTPRAKKVLELALREALSLVDFDADAEKIRNEVIRMLSGLTGRMLVSSVLVQPVSRLRAGPTDRVRS